MILVNRSFRHPSISSLEEDGARRVCYTHGRQVDKYAISCEVKRALVRSMCEEVPFRHCLSVVDSKGGVRENDVMITVQAIR